MTAALRIALALGLAVDAYVAVLAVFFPGRIPAALDIPTTDRLALLLGGGEYAVVACVYALALRDPRRSRALLWICAIDQLFAVVIPALLVLRGDLPASWKVLAPIPVQAAFAAIFIRGALLPGARNPGAEDGTSRAPRSR